MQELVQDLQGLQSIERRNQPARQVGATPDAIELHEVFKCFKQRGYTKAVFQNLSVGFEANRVSLIFGRNGSGKSTLLRIVAGLILPDKGEVISNLDTLVYAGSGPSCLIGKLTVLENIYYFAEIHGFKVQLNYLSELLSKFDITDKQHDLVEYLSKGTQQKVLLTRALAVRPRMILLDEPTEYLDDAATATLSGEMHQRALCGLGGVIATHDQRLRAIDGSVSFQTAAGTCVLEQSC